MTDHYRLRSLWRTTGPYYVLTSALVPIRNTFLYVFLILECVRFKLIFNAALHQPNPVITVLKFLVLWVPLYVGIAMQLGLFVGLSFGLAQLCKTRELDALHAVGCGLHQLMAPIAGLGLGIGFFGLIIIGWSQPLSLYESKLFLHDIEQSSNFLLAGTDLFFIKGRKTVMLDNISADGTEFERVFIYETHPDGKTVTSAGTSGRLMTNGGFNNLHYFVKSVDVMELAANGKNMENRTLNIATTSNMQNVTGPLENDNKAPFRQRGQSEYEWTMGELFAPETGSSVMIEPYKLSAELNYRLVQVLFIVLTPFLAALTVIEPRRNPGPIRFFLGMIAVLGFYQYMSYGASISRNNFLPPVITLWLPLAAVYAVTMLKFWKLAYRPAFQTAR
jgi:lipopolysaccharide export system permease protein